MAAAAATGPSSSTNALGNINDSKKRWMVFGLALKDLVDQIRSFVEKEVQKDFDNLKTSHGIDSQSSSGRLKKWSSTFLKYENINGNDAVPKLPHGKFNYAAFDCRVMSHVDYAKLYLENYMAKFTVFDEHCDASAVLNLLGRVPVFSLAAQGAAHDVRQDRNAWAHCAFQDWDPAKFQQYFQDMKRLVNALGLPAADETKLLADLNTWEKTGPSLCMNPSVDATLLQMVQQHVHKLIADVDNMAFEVDCDRETVEIALQDVAADVKELEKRISVVEKENKGLKRSMESFQDEQRAMGEKFKSLKSDHDFVQQRVTQVEEQLRSPRPQVSFEISHFEADIAFLAERHDPDTRGWLFADINSWFRAPGDSRAYVLLGDAGVGKSVIAGALAKRAQDDGYLGAAYFCRHNDETRNDPRNLLGTIACQLCKCSVEYSNIVGGEGGVRMTLANSNLSIGGLFTKLLQEPLGKCMPCEQRKLVIIDALDETEYKSRDDFLDLITHRFPRLPKWLLFFITSRPEDTVQFTLKNYNPCVKICAGYGKHLNVYQQHEQDIKQFFEKRVDFSCLPCTVEIVTKKCNGLFLYAFYMVEVLNNLACSGNIGELTELFPGDIDDFFYVNFKRIFDKVGADLFRTLFGCVAASPSPLPRSFISFLLKTEKSNLNEQEVIDTVSIFLVHRASDLTFTFLHNLIPSWLTDRNKARRFFVDITVARKYLKKIVLEFLPSSVINVSSEKYSSIEIDLLDYVLHFGVRLLCKCDDIDSMKIAHNFLTSYQFIQKRIQKSRIGVYSLIGDLKLSAGCQNLSDTEKETLQGVCRALERSIHTLWECPYLLPSCLQMVSKAVKLNITIPDGVSTTWMEWSWLPFPAPKAPHNKVSRCLAFSPDRKLLAQFQEGGISLFNSCSLERLLGPVKLNAMSDVKCLAFSSCGDFVFFGKFDKVFSVQRGIIETYVPLQKVHLQCEWCSFTLDRQHIVVKCSSLPTPTCWLCLLNHLCLWAKLEIERSGKREPLCRCFPNKLEVTRKFPQLATYQGSRITAMRPLLNLLSEMKCEEWCSLLEKVQLDRGDLTFLVPDCLRCELSRDYEALTLKEVRQFVIDHYSNIFKYQVWDARTGKPVLNVALSSGVEVCPFIHFCHLGTAFETCGTLFTGIDKALSLANIALLSTICHHLLFRENFLEKYLFRSFPPRPAILKWYYPRPDGTVSFMVDSQNVKRVIKEIRCYAALEEDVVVYVTHESRLCALCLQTGTTTVLDSSEPIMKVLYRDAVLHLFLTSDDTIEARALSNYLTSDDTIGTPASSTYTFTDLSNGDTYEAIEKVSVLSTVSPIIASELENFPDEGKKVFFSDSVPCLSPGVIWVAKPFVKSRCL